MKLFIYLIPLLFFVSCNGRAPEEREQAADGGAKSTPQQDTTAPGIGYRLSAPDKTYILPDNLKELSGMQYIGNGLVACIQDEKGIVYLFDIEEGRLVQEIAWGEKGDYEGVAGDGSVLYVLESGGELYSISNFSGSSKPRVQKRKVPLEKGCDAEGLYLLEEKNLLLIGCKEGVKGIRNVWAFDLQNGQLLSTPYLQIPQEALEKEVVETGLDRFSLGLKKVLDAKSESGVLAPSGMARHPITGDFYILSHQSKLLVVISPTGELKYVEELLTSLFQQPESITFTTEGDMLIGNEAKGGEPNILRFEYDKENQ